MFERICPQFPHLWVVHIFDTGILRYEMCAPFLRFKLTFRTDGLCFNFFKLDDFKLEKCSLNYFVYGLSKIAIFST